VSTLGVLPDGGSVARIDEFIVVVDASRSMGGSYEGEPKIGIAQALARSLGRTIPEIGFRGALRTFGQASCLPRGETARLFGPARFSRAEFTQATYRLKCSGGGGRLDAALAAAGKDLSASGEGKAVIVISDGLIDVESTLQAAEALKGVFGDDLCISAIQIGDKEEGETLLARLVEVGGCGINARASDLSEASALGEFVGAVFLDHFTDPDDVPDRLDLCPDTPSGVQVDEHGCPLDSDGDGVPDYLDKCSRTAKRVPVDSFGCALDSDGDGASDDMDRCPNTPRGVLVNVRGCPRDLDRDGVTEDIDACPGTPRGTKVDERGCPHDSDGDGVIDERDACPDTPAGTLVGLTGCPSEVIVEREETWVIRGEVLFDLNSHAIKPEAAFALDRVADQLKLKPMLRLEIGGHCDVTGPERFNQELSELRAAAARDYLVAGGISADRLTTRGYGSAVPVVPNDTSGNRARNRRVELEPIR